VHVTELEVEELVVVAELEVEELVVGDVEEVVEDVGEELGFCVPLLTLPVGGRPLAGGVQVAPVQTYPWFSGGVEATSTMFTLWLEVAGAQFAAYRLALQP